MRERESERKKARERERERGRESVSDSTTGRVVEDGLTPINYMHLLSRCVSVTADAVLPVERNSDTPSAALIFSLAAGNRISPPVMALRMLTTGPAGPSGPPPAGTAPGALESAPVLPPCWCSCCSAYSARDSSQLGRARIAVGFNF